MVRVQEHENIQNQNLQGSHCNIYIYIDAKVVVELVQSETTSNAFYSSLLVDCRSLLGRFQHSNLQGSARVPWSE